MKQTVLSFLILLLIFSCNGINYSKNVKAQNVSQTISSTRKIKKTLVINQTFLGNAQRNFYGNIAPSQLDIIWIFGQNTTIMEKLKVFIFFREAEKVQCFLWVQKLSGVIEQ